MDINMAGTLKVSKKIWAAVSLLVRGFKGASVNSTGCYKSSQPNSQRGSFTTPAQLPLTSSDSVCSSVL